MPNDQPQVQGNINRHILLKFDIMGYNSLNI